MVGAAAPAPPGMDCVEGCGLNGRRPLFYLVSIPSIKSILSIVLLRPGVIPWGLTLSLCAAVAIEALRGSAVPFEGGGLCRELAVKQGRRHH